MTYAFHVFVKVTAACGKPLIATLLSVLRGIQKGFVMTRTKKPRYQWVATTREGFVKQVAEKYLLNGYRFYFSAEIKPSRDLSHFDRVMEEKFRFNMSRNQRWLRSQATDSKGRKLRLGNVHYLRFGRIYFLGATYGSHPFFQHHETRDKNGDRIEKHWRDAHEDRLFVPWVDEEGEKHCYSIRLVADGGMLPKRLWRDSEVPEFEGKPRVRVRIAQTAFETLQAGFLAKAKSTRYSASDLECLIYNLPYLPYKPICQQLKGMVRRMNKVRGERGFKDRLDPGKAVRWKQPPIKVFELPKSEVLPRLAA